MQEHDNAFSLSCGYLMETQAELDISHRVGPVLRVVIIGHELPHAGQIETLELFCGTDSRLTSSTHFCEMT